MSNIIGAGVLLYFTENNTDYILLGREGKWVLNIYTDIVTPTGDVSITDLQLLDITDVNAAYKEANNRVKMIQTHHSNVDPGSPFIFHYSQLEKRTDNKPGFFVKFVYYDMDDDNKPRSEFKLGIPKGHLHSKVVENPSHAAMRELQEEFGIKDINESAFSNVLTTVDNYVIFKIKLDPLANPAFFNKTRERIQKMEDILFGEMFRRGFFPLTFLIENQGIRSQMNKKTRDAIDAFHAYRTQAQAQAKANLKQKENNATQGLLGMASGTYSGSPEGNVAVSNLLSLQNVSVEDLMYAPLNASNINTAEILHGLSELINIHSPNEGGRRRKTRKHKNKTRKSRKGNRSTHVK